MNTHNTLPSNEQVARASMFIDRLLAKYGESLTEPIGDGITLDELYDMYGIQEHYIESDESKLLDVPHLAVVLMMKGFYSVKRGSSTRMYHDGL